MTLIETLVAVAECWALTNDRSIATLASRVAKDGKLFGRIATGSTPTVATFDRLIAYLRDPANWREGVIPQRAAALLAIVPPIDHDAPLAGGADSDEASEPSPDKSADRIGRATAQVAA